MADKPFKTTWKIGEVELPVKIYQEWRRSARASLRQGGLIIRIPSFLTGAQKEAQMMNFRNWAQQQLHKNQHIAGQFQKRTYKDGDQLKVGSRTYTIRIEETNLASHHAAQEGDTILLRLTTKDSPDHAEKAIRHLLSRTIANDFLPAITEQVMELNRKHVQKPIKKVSLKYNHSNWGSCSTKGNINLSTRLLFAPDDVIEYVIKHELAHLIEANHSDRFWKVVEDMMPDYKEKEKWLKVNGWKCDF
ncbi:MAG: M48 family metallopeptidase [Saprospiraceae bacterium]|nr:M48 family metallopeptidase [Saprospiraceae bacterium]